MIAEAGHYALVLALALALIQSTVPILTGRLVGLTGFTVNAHSTVLVNN